MSKRVLKKHEGQQWLRDNHRNRTLHFRWGKTGVCTLLDMGGKKAHGGCSSPGGGYDKMGDQLGTFLTHRFQKQLQRLDSRDYYGLIHYNPRTKKYQAKSSPWTNTYVNGACGFETCQNILSAIGFDLLFVSTNDSNTYYVMQPL
jgi:hypothetical protein